MAIMDLEYIEIDGLLYLNIEIEGSEVLKNHGKYGFKQPETSKTARVRKTQILATA